MSNRNDAFYSDQEALKIIEKALDSGRVEITALQSALLDDGSTKEPVFCIHLTLLDVEEDCEGHVKMVGLVQTVGQVSIPKPKPPRAHPWTKEEALDAVLEWGIDCECGWCDGCVYRRWEKEEVSIPKPKPECPEDLVPVVLDYCDADDCYADLEYHDELSAGLCRQCQRRINGAKDGEE